MGHRSLRPARVHEIASSFLETSSRQLRTPPWLTTIGKIPPGEILTRTQPAQVRHTPRVIHKKIRKPSKLFTPQHITYPEDKVRQQFFEDHPWELARPRLLLEQDGKDGEKVDWSRLQQSGKQLNGESVVQRQLWLLQNEVVTNPETGREEAMTSQQAYDKARSEFYAIRHAEEVERRVAREEALSAGAYFGLSRIEIGMELEDQSFESWKAWATTEIALIEQQRNAAYTGSEAEQAVAASTPAFGGSEQTAEEETVV